MNDPWKEKWNERYGMESYAYGTEPNEFLEDQLKALKPGRILFPAEGEGRNAVFAAKNGWEVSAFDFSHEAQKKAQKLAETNEVNIDYHLGELSEMQYEVESFDCIALIFAHFPGPVKSTIHKKLLTLLKKGGTVIFEAFSKKHLYYQNLNAKVGGPKDLETLFSIAEIEEDFKEFTVKMLEEKEINLSEGQYHQGKGSVIRFVGIKN